MLGSLTPIEIDDFLGDRYFAHLGCQSDGEIYVVPISFVYSGGRLIGQTKEGRKVEMLRKNPSCCVQLDKINSVADWTSVIVWGTFEELKGHEAIEAMGLLIDRFGPKVEVLGGSRNPRDITPSASDSERQVKILYSISIREKSGRFETSH